MDVTAMTEAQYQLVRSFFERRDALDPSARAALARQIVAAIAPAVRTPQWLPDEPLLEAAAAAYRRRVAGR